MKDRNVRIWTTVVCLLSPTLRLAAQDAFDIVVYPATTAARGEWELETHLNYTARGTTTFDGTVAPTQHQTHLTFELTRGITTNWEAAAVDLRLGDATTIGLRVGAGTTAVGNRLVFASRLEVEF